MKIKAGIYEIINPSGLQIGRTRYKCGHRFKVCEREHPATVGLMSLYASALLIKRVDGHDSFFRDDGGSQRIREKAS